MSECKLIHEKLSGLLRQAYYNGVKKIEGAFKRDGGYCAAGYINEFDVTGLLDNAPIVKYGKPWDELSIQEKLEFQDILDGLVQYNDLSPDITFLDCARFLEEKGL